MSLRYYIDHNVPKAIVDGLRRREVDCLTAREDGAARIDDESVARRAAETGRVLFSTDTDFLEVASRWIRSGTDFPGLVFAEQLGVTIGDAVADLELIAKIYEPEEIRNQILWLPL